METLSQPISSENPSECRQELVERLDILRRNQSFCDVKVVVKDKELTAHKAVLAAASPFFLSLLTSDMRESKEHLIRTELEEATAAVMEDALQYIYTGNVSVTEENAHNLMATADYLLLPGLKTKVGRYLMHILTIENCVFYYYFADKYQCVMLKEKACEMINSDFSAVMETDDFLGLDIKQVMEWVSSDDITVNAEEEVFRGIVKWVSYKRSERDFHFPELLHEVRLVSISHDFLLNKLVKEELVAKNTKLCLNFVLDAMRLMVSSNDDQVVQQPRKCLQELCLDAIFVSGGRRAYCYFPVQNEWYMLSNKPFQYDQFSRSSNPSQCRGKIYIFSQNLDELDSFQLMEFYSPVNNTWGEFQLARFTLTNGNTAVFKGYLYATGHLLRSNGICIYVPEKPEFCTELKKPPTALFYSCLVTDEEYIYLISGISDCDDGSSLLSTTYRCDPSADDYEWEEVAPVNQARYNAFGAAMNGKVYIAGGRQGLEEALYTCEVYNPVTNEWQLMPSLNVPRMSASMVCHEGRLYVLGGVNSSSRVLSVEIFDSEQNEWNKTSVIPTPALFETRKEREEEITFKACSARLCKEVIKNLEPLNNFM